MDSAHIFSLLKNDHDVDDSNFLGVFASDMIPLSALSFPCCFVANTKPSSHSGEHWIAVIKSSKNEGYYFDSYGMPPTNFPEIAMVLEPCVEWNYNSKQLQSLLTTVCGQYCVFFILHIARGLTPNQIVSFLDDSGDTAANDAFIYAFFKHRYDNFDDSVLIDFPFVRKQIANQFHNV